MAEAMPPQLSKHEKAPSQKTKNHADGVAMEGKGLVLDEVHPR